MEKPHSITGRDLSTVQSMSVANGETITQIDSLPLQGMDLYDHSANPSTELKHFGVGPVPTAFSRWTGDDQQPYVKGDISSLDGTDAQLAHLSGEALLTYGFPAARQPPEAKAGGAQIYDRTLESGPVLESWKKSEKHYMNCDVQEVMSARIKEMQQQQQPTRVPMAQHRLVLSSQSHGSAYPGQVWRATPGDPMPPQSSRPMSQYVQGTWTGEAPLTYYRQQTHDRYQYSPSVATDDMLGQEATPQALFESTAVQPHYNYYPAQQLSRENAIYDYTHRASTVAMNAPWPAYGQDLSTSPGSFAGQYFAAAAPQCSAAGPGLLTRSAYSSFDSGYGSGNVS